MKRKLIKCNKRFWTKVLHFVNDNEINFKTYYALRESAYYYQYYRNNPTTISNKDDGTIFDWDNYTSVENVVFVPIISSSSIQCCSQMFFTHRPLPPKLEKRLPK